jgi:uncharacterized membrane-anchored protein
MPEAVLEQRPAPAGFPSWVDRIRDGMRNRERGILLGAAGFQLLVLVLMIATRASVLLSGETVLLRVVPVDPRDLLRGDYVILGYEFTRPAGGVTGLSSQAMGDGGQTVYVPLVQDPDGIHWRSGQPTVSRPAGGKFLRGTWSGGRIECGIESYYVQEGKGRQYEQALRERRLSAEVAVDREGHAVLRGLRVE